MAEMIRNFVQGTMNKDIDQRLLPDGQYIDALNVKVGSAELQNIGSLQNDLGNEQISDIASVTAEIVENAMTIGSLSVPQLNLIYWLVASDNFDAIFEIDLNTTPYTTTRVAQANKTLGNPSKLNFNQFYLAHSIDYVNGQLLWTEMLNGPRKINIARWKSYSVDDARMDIDLALIKNPPLFAPTFELSNDGSQSTNMSEKFLYFAYRYKYIDNEYSSLSPFSPAAFRPDEYNFNPQLGYNKAMINKYNKAAITMETGNEFVTDIQLVMHDSFSKNTYIVETFNKSKLNIQSNFSYTFSDFSNNKTYTALPSDQVTRLFDNVPLKAEAQALIGNRVVFGNIVQFYDITDSSGNEINVNYSVDYVSDIAIPTTENPLPTFRSNRDYEIGLLYTDNYGRMSTVLTSLTNTVYIDPSVAHLSNSLKVNITSIAPSWATHWRLAIKQTKQDYYNLFPILFYQDGSYRYFLLNQSDRDKISVGDYITFKSGPAGLTYSNKEYKILEIEYKNAGFIGGNAISEIAGLYFKIKVDDPTEFSASLLYTYSSSGVGYSSTQLAGGGGSAKATTPPVADSSWYSVAENPIFYGDGNGGVLTIGNNNIYTGSNDYRYTIEIESSGSSPTFRYTRLLSGSGPYIESGVAITSGVDIPILDSTGGTPLFYIQFSTNTGFVVGDKWKINCRSNDYSLGAGNNYFGGIGINPFDYYDHAEVGGYSIIPGNNWSPTTIETDRQINIGAVITINIVEDSENASGQAGPQTFPPSDRLYENIEEWFVESGAYIQFKQYDINANNVGASRVSFRRGKSFHYASPGGGSSASNVVNSGYNVSDPNATAEKLAYPVRMVIAGCGIPPNNNTQNRIVVTFSIQQQENENIVETVPKENGLDIYYELTRTRPVGEGGAHIVNWQYEDFIFHGDSDPVINGMTGLTQLTPTTPHSFNIGDEVEVVTSLVWLNGVHTIVAIPSAYEIVVDVAFSAPGPVTGGYVKANSYDTDQDTSSFQGATVIINNPINKNDNFNAFSFGNGLESDRIKDDFNRATLEYSQRALTTIEDYKQTHNENELVYSGVYQQTSSINRLNEFNLSTVNFKYMDKSYGAVKKLHPRDTDLVVFQENKIHSVLYGKNLLSDSVGGGSVTSVPEVLGTPIPFQYENGISKNPESFAYYGSDMFCTDAYRGEVLQISGMEIVRASSMGMRNYFKEMFLDGLNTRKLGGFDPFTRTYVLASNDISTDKCYLNLNKIVGTFPSKDSFYNLFLISSNSNWTITLDDTGDGTDWLTLSTDSGSGNSLITGFIDFNNTGLDRSLHVTITYCGGLTTGYDLVQYAVKTGIFGGVIYVNSGENESTTKL